MRLSAQPNQKDRSVAERLDEQFIEIMKEVEKCYDDMSRHDKVKIEHWTKKLCEITMNVAWKRNRNDYAALLLDMMWSGHLGEPFDKLPADGPLPILNKQLIVIIFLLRESKIMVYFLRISIDRKMCPRQLGIAPKKEGQPP